MPVIWSKKIFCLSAFFLPLHPCSPWCNDSSNVLKSSFHPCHWPRNRKQSEASLDLICTPQPVISFKPGRSGATERERESKRWRRRGGDQWHKDTTREKQRGGELLHLNRNREILYGVEWELRLYRKRTCIRVNQSQVYLLFVTVIYLEHAVNFKLYHERKKRSDRSRPSWLLFRWTS